MAAKDHDLVGVDLRTARVRQQPEVVLVVQKANLGVQDRPSIAGNVVLFNALGQLAHPQAAAELKQNL